MYDNIILIPYRNRKKHLDYFFSNSWNLIKEHLKNTKLVILEQEEGKLFNRGKILNVGFKEYLDKTKYFITHDVDVNPKNNTMLLYNKDDIDSITGIFNSPCITLGGICKISSKNVDKMNGFPNNYYGWGCEDKALYNRAVYNNIKINYNHYSNDKNIETYFIRFNDIDDRIRDNTFGIKTNFEYNYFKKLNREKQYEHIMSSGLNNLEYKILEKKEIMENVDWIKVSI